MSKDCKHLRKSGQRVEAKDGTDYTCLDCGFEWFEKDKELTEAEQWDKDAFEREKKAGRV